MTTPTSGRVRYGRFAGGFLIGFLVPAGVGALTWLGMLNMGLLPKPPGGHLRVEISGADVTRAGGRSGSFDEPNGGVIWTCRGACDDLRFVADKRGLPDRVKINDEHASCIACLSPVSDEEPRTYETWTVAGAPLKISREVHD